MKFDNTLLKSKEDRGQDKLIDRIIELQESCSEFVIPLSRAF